MSEEQTAVVESSPTDIIASLTPEQYQQWRADGSLPEEPAKTQEDSSPPSPGQAEAPAGEQEPETKAAAPEPAAKQKAERKRGAPERIQELLAEVKALKSQLAEREAPKPKDEKKAEPSPAVGAKPTVEKNPATGQPWASYEEYMEALTDWKVEDAKRSLLDALESERKAETQAQIDAKVEEARQIQVQQWSQRLDAARARHKDYDAVALSDEMKSSKGPIVAGGPIDSYVLDSPEGAEVLYYLGSHPEELAEIGSLSHAAQYRRLAQIELSLTPSAKARPKLPGPAREIAGTGTAPADPIASAISKGDVRRYIELANAKDASRMTRR